MKPRFEIPGDLTKQISGLTQKHYQAKLNRLAAAGFTTRSDLLEKQKEVCTTINEQSGEDNGSGRQMRRLFLSAVFWILHERPLDEKRVYYEEFQKAKDNYVAPMTQISEWKDIEGTSYQAHPSGVVRRCWKHKQQELKPYVDTLGYKHVALTTNGVRKRYSMGRLIATLFVPNPTNKPEVDHINNDPGDNRVENLRWADRSEQLLNRRGWAQSGIRHIRQVKDKWRVAIFRNKQMRFQKLYNTKEEAIKARDEFLATL